MTLEARIVAALEAIGLDMKGVIALAGARALRVLTQGGQGVFVPLTAQGELVVGVAGGGSVAIKVEVGV